ncbi:MAG: family 43 glycosylhydrolase [Actinomycetaceae bacterium]|nr:family 43 glycosylhydrolase [Actinomycetaceae bacterium]
MTAVSPPQDRHEAMEQYMSNPIIPGFHPDPSVCRVGNDYYLACSTFEYLPGIPIFHSTDLENFELISHVIVRDGQSGVKGVPTQGGIWAPTIRHHNGKFYLVVPDMMGDGRGNILYTADHPAGPWDDGVVMEVLGIDPDIAWDDEGTCYVTMSGFIFDEETGTLIHQGITQVTLDPTTGKALTPPKRLWSGTGGMFPEAPHLYHIGDYWYLMIAEGGTERGHSVTIARGPAPDGPFTGAAHNPLITARGTDRPAQNTGHGDLVEKADGSWAMVLLGTRPRSMTRAFAPMGRETFCVPVTWIDGWPHAEQVHLGERRPAVERTITFPAEGPGSLDAFDGEIIAVRAFPREVADLSARPGWARLIGHGVDMTDAHPTFIGIRQCTEAMETEVDLDVSAGSGGVCLRYDEVNHFVIRTDGTEVTATIHARGLSQSWSHSLATPATEVTLRIVADPPEGGKAVLGASCDRVVAYVRDEGQWVEIAGVDGAFLSSDFAESFTGRVFGAWAEDGQVDVKEIRYVGQDIQR